MKRLLITSGRGPAECRIALAKFVSVLKREAEAFGLSTAIVEGPSPDRIGPGSVIVVLYGDDAQTFAKDWTGSIQWIARSPVRPHHKRRNWFIGVFDLPPMPEASIPLDERDVRFESFRAGGPGGQHQNTTESAVRAVHIPTGLCAIARDERSQHRNKALALERLAELLRLREEIAVMAERQNAQALHDCLERGKPVKRFRGDAFSPA